MNKRDTAKSLRHSCVLSLMAIALLHAGLAAQTPGWSTKVAPILYNHCTSCHHSGGIAPFPLITYGDALYNASGIKNDVLLNKMPPWPPDPAYAHLAHEPLLSDEEIAIISAWADNGAPPGDISLSPPMPLYPNSGVIPGVPDLIVKMPVYTSTADTTDVYRCFVIPSGLIADRHIRALEAIPGNPACVHHVIVYADTTGAFAAIDSASPGPGYPYFDNMPADSCIAVGVWLPGCPPMAYPPGFGLKLPRHCDILMQIHYPAGTAGMQDSTELHLFFAPDTGIREVYLAPYLHHDMDLVNGPLYIPADSIKTFAEEYPTALMTRDLSLLGIFPHMHLTAKKLKSYGVLPGGDTDRYVCINDWDFHWQNLYMFPKLKKAPAGTLLRAEATFDNTTGNPDNPNSPPQDVWAGESTKDEMMIVGFVVTDYRPGDENISNEPPVLNIPDQPYYTGQQLLDVSPNPATDNIVVKCFTDVCETAAISLKDMGGKTVRIFDANKVLGKGYTTSAMSVAGIAPGTYMLNVKTPQKIMCKKIVILQH